MSRIEDYRKELRNNENWEPYLLQQSRLPGPRGNIELGQAVALEGDEKFFNALLDYDADMAPTNTPGEFLAFCGILGLGRLLAEGKVEYLGKLRILASDPRWRVREGVAMALQRFGRADIETLLGEMFVWSKGNFLERRAAVAAICEPDLLRSGDYSDQVFELLSEITESLRRVEDRKNDGFIALRKALGYCWSVAVYEYPQPGKAIMEGWFSERNKDIRWVMKQNLKKNRLQRLDRIWVAEWSNRL